MKNQVNLLNPDQKDIDFLCSNPFYGVEDPRGIIILHKSFLESADKLFVFKNTEGGISVWSDCQISHKDKKDDNEC